MAEGSKSFIESYFTFIGSWNFCVINIYIINLIVIVHPINIFAQLNY